MNKNHYHSDEKENYDRNSLRGQFMQENLSIFADKLCLVTGAGQGIGLSCTKRLLAQGARVIACDLDRSTLEDLYESLSKVQQDRTTLLPFDLSDWHSIQAACQYLLQDKLLPTHIVMCAGTLSISSALELKPEALDNIINVNLKGTLLLTQQLVKVLVDHNLKGSVVVIGSNAADTPRVNMSAYCASKAGIHMWVKCLAQEVAQYGIRCNIVSPGSTRTPMQTQLWNKEHAERDVIQGDLNCRRLGIPLNKIAEPEEITDAIEFLLSDKASHITMHDLRVDGGATF